GEALAAALRLARDDEIVLRVVVEVEEGNRVALLSVPAILLERYAVSEDRMELLARFDEGSRRNVRDRANGFLDVFLGKPGIEPPQSRTEALREHHLLQRLTLRFERFGR